MAKTKTPYEQGYEAALVPPPDDNVHQNPYSAGTHEYKEWEEGFGDGTDDYIAWMGSDA